MVQAVVKLMAGAEAGSVVVLALVPPQQIFLH
jgi:hypothetical protein